MVVMKCDISTHIHTECVIHIVISGIYVIICSTDNKFYIGSAANVNKRIKHHFSRLKSGKHINRHLQAAFNSYGEENFFWQIIEECDTAQLLEQEQFWMDFTKCYDREIGFNNCVKADRPLGYKHTEEAKQRMSILKLGTKQTKESIEKRKIANTGKKRTEEFKKMLSNSRIGDKNPMFGRKEGLDHKKERMKNFLATPRWNKGLTKETDERVKKLAFWTGKVTVNALRCELLDMETAEKWTADSLKKLSLITPISLPTINRLKNGNAGKRTSEKYKLNIL